MGWLDELGKIGESILDPLDLIDTGGDIGKIVEFTFDPFDMVDTGGKVAPSNLLGIGDNADDGLEQATAAQQEAADKQLQLGRENIAFMREQGQIADEKLRPFTEFGTPSFNLFDTLTGQRNTNLEQANQLVDPNIQADFLQNNPMFNAAIDSTQRAIGSQGAASGKRGGMIDALFKNYMSTGQSFINNRFNQLGSADAMYSNHLNRLLQPIGIAQASAAGQAANVQNTAQNVGVGNQNMSNIYGNIGDINSASAMAGQNIRNQQQQGLFNLIGGALAGGTGMIPGIAGGLGGAGRGALLSR